MPIGLDIWRIETFCCTIFFIVEVEREKFSADL